MSVEYNKLKQQTTKKSEQELNSYVHSMLVSIDRLKRNKEFLVEYKGKINKHYWLIQMICQMFKVNFSKKTVESYYEKMQKEGVKILKQKEKFLILRYNDTTIIVAAINNNGYNFNYVTTTIEQLRKCKHEAKIVTGYIKCDTSEVKQLLSWLEITNGNNAVVADYFNNIVIDKNSFYMFYHPEILNEIKKRVS